MAWCGKCAHSNRGCELLRRIDEAIGSIPLPAEISGFRYEISDVECARFELRTVALERGREERRWEAEQSRLQKERRRLERRLQRSTLTGVQQRAWDLRARGVEYRDMAQQLGCTRQALHQAFRAAERKLAGKTELEEAIAVLENRERLTRLLGEGTSISGNGRFAVVIHCGSPCAYLWNDLRKAEGFKAMLDKDGCGDGCEAKHELLDLAGKEETARLGALEGEGREEASGPPAIPIEDRESYVGIDKALYDMPAWDLPLTIRSANALWRADIRTVGELARRTREGLLSIKGFGAKSLCEIEEELGKRRLWVGMKFEYGSYRAKPGD